MHPIAILSVRDARWITLPSLHAPMLTTGDTASSDVAHSAARGLSRTAVGDIATVRRAIDNPRIGAARRAIA